MAERARPGTRRVVWDGEAKPPRERVRAAAEAEAADESEWVHVMVEGQEGRHNVQMRQQTWRQRQVRAARALGTWAVVTRHEVRAAVARHRARRHWARARERVMARVHEQAAEQRSAAQVRTSQQGRTMEAQQYSEARTWTRRASSTPQHARRRVAAMWSARVGTRLWWWMEEAETSDPRGPMHARVTARHRRSSGDEARASAAPSDDELQHMSTWRHGERHGQIVQQGGENGRHEGAGGAEEEGTTATRDSGSGSSTHEEQQMHERWPRRRIHEGNGVHRQDLKLTADAAREYWITDAERRRETAA